MPQLNLLKEIEILNAQRRASDYMIGDGGNLYVRVQPGKYTDKRAGKDWWFRYQFNGATKKLALGSYTDLTVKEARDKAAEMRKQLDHGIDPKRQRDRDDAERKIAEQEPQTVAEAYQVWKATRLVDRKDGGKEVHRLFTKDVLPAIGAIPLKSLRRRHLTAIFDSVKGRGAKRIVGHLLTESRLLVKFAIEREWIDSDITSVLKASNWGGQSRPRSRVLEHKEIVELRDKVSKAGLKKSTGAAIWIMLSTMCRVGALERARWKDIDFEHGTWKAARKSAGEEQYTIYLSSFAVRHFQLIKAEQDALIERKLTRGETIDEDRFQWVFPAKNPRRSGQPQHVTDKTLSKQIYSYQRKKPLKGRAPATGKLRLSGGPFSAHDLRRTGSTYMTSAEVGVEPRFRELCLDHGPKNPLDRSYDQNKYKDEMKDAWERLGAFLERLLGH